VNKYTKSTLIAAVSLAALLPTLTGAEEPQIEFTGIPDRITSVGWEQNDGKFLSNEESKQSICVIHKIDDKYYWASRDNRELVKVPSGSFTNYIAINGAGYVKVINPAEKSAASFLGKTEEDFDYVEHLVTGLKAIIYYGQQSK
jgi:hypothetical protein